MRIRISNIGCMSMSKMHADVYAAKSCLYPCCMPLSMSMIHVVHATVQVCAACPCSTTMQHANAACQCCKSMLHVILFHIAYIRFASCSCRYTRFISYRIRFALFVSFQIRFACKVFANSHQCCMPTLHVKAACPYCKLCCM
jgi:hypothetical protein